MASYSYDPSNIVGDTVDRMRFELGDTQVEGERDTCALCDEEYSAILRKHKRWKQAKIACLRAIVARFAMMVDFHADGMTIEFSRRYERWKKELNDLEKSSQFISANASALGANTLDGGHYFRFEMHANPAAAIAANENLK